MSVFMLVSCQSPAGSVPEGAKLCFPQRCFDVEIARTLKERSRGLQDRTRMDPGRGMLFVFPESGKHTFWMKDTLISLDMIWIDRYKRVATIMTDVPPCRTDQCPVYTPDRAGMYVLELNAGTSVKMGLKVGDQAAF